mmetsp:Transcript_29447/g.80815  ORF Transcript_29447/g.80815 Transcript_29447/m.80815 type:complete len:353 (+) Transcript_29447:448-1506(+)
MHCVCRHQGGAHRVRMCSQSDSSRESAPIRSSRRAHARRGSRRLRVAVQSVDSVDRILRKVGVLQRLLGGDAARRLKLQHAHEQVEAVGVILELGHVMLQSLALHGRVRLLVVGQICERGPRLVRRVAEHGEDPHQLVGVGRSREERLSGRHLAKDAADRPQVDGRRVFARTHQHVGRAVPQRYHLVRVAAHRDTKRARQAKVCELELLVVLIDEQILRLEVAVQHPPVVAEGDAEQQLAQQHLQVQVGQASVAVRLVEHLLQVLVEILEDERQLLLGVDNVVKADDVGVLQLLEDGYLTDRRRRDALVLRLEANLLERDEVTRKAVLCLVHDAISALTNLLDLLILLHGGF